MTRLQALINNAALFHGTFWEQDKAYVTAEKYKEGKFILEKELTVDVQ